MTCYGYAVLALLNCGNHIVDSMVVPNILHIKLLINIIFLQDHINNWRATALILTSVLFLASGIWFIGKDAAFSYYDFKILSSRMRPFNVVQ